MHRTTAVTFAAVLLIGSISAGFAQGTGRGSVGGAGTPGIGTAPGIGSVGGAGTPGIGTAPSIGTGGSAGTPGVGTAPGIGTGGSAGTPGVGTGKAAGTPGVGTGGSTNPSDTLPGMPAGNQSGNQSDNQSGNQSGNRSGNRLGTAPRHVPTLGETQDADIKAEYLEAMPYQPCPANVRFPNGQQMCLGLPGNPSYRPYTSQK